MPSRRDTTILPDFTTPRGVLSTSAISTTELHPRTSPGWTRKRDCAQRGRKFGSAVPALASMYIEGSQQTVPRSLLSLLFFTLCFLECFGNRFSFLADKLPFRHS